MSVARHVGVASPIARHAMPQGIRLSQEPTNTNRAPMRPKVIADTTTTARRTVIPNLAERTIGRILDSVAAQLACAPKGDGACGSVPPLDDGVVGQRAALLVPNFQSRFLARCMGGVLSWAADSRSDWRYGSQHPGITVRGNSRRLMRSCRRSRRSVSRVPRIRPTR